MKTPAVPDDERQRLQTLRALNILDTPPEERFDRLTRLAKRLFGVPIALVSLVDDNRQWFKSSQGLETCETGRDISFCGHAILGDNILIVPDASTDERFFDNPLVINEPNIRFYAGCPLRVPNGSRLGTFCIIDQEPRYLDDDERELLTDLAAMAEQELVAIQLATMDDLTLLSNRRGFMTLCQHAMNMCRRLNKPGTLFYLDLDYFKPINDRFGHAEGDLALQRFAELIKQTFRESDVIGRLGGDEFAVFLTATDVAQTELLLTRLQQSVKRYNEQAQRGYDIEFSAGAMAFDPETHRSVDALLDAADGLMYRQKGRRTRQIPDR